MGSLSVGREKHGSRHVRNLMLEKKDDVTIFLNGPSVNYASLGSKEYPLNDLAKLFTLSEGRLLA
jgi:uncharacterized protein involved in oxidation of intracellular sulfur